MSENNLQIPQPGARIQIDPAEIVIPEGRLVSRQDEHIDELAESMRKLGQITPAGVYFDREGRPVLIYGRHRTEAARRLGWKVDAIVHAPDLKPERLRAIEAAENLNRLTLSATQRAEHVRAIVADVSAEAGRDMATPAARKHGDRETLIKRVKSEAKTSRGTAEMLVDISSLSPAVLQAVKATPALDSVDFLKKLARLPDDESRFRRITAEARASAENRRKAKAIDPQAAADMAAGLLKQCLTPGEVMQLVGLLTVTTTRHLASALSADGRPE